MGYFDDETCRLKPIDNPFGPKVLRMSSAPCVRIVVACLGLWTSGARKRRQCDQTILTDVQAKDAR